MARRSEFTARPKSKDLSSLKLLVHYIAPYKWMFIGAMVALLLTSGSVLGLGRGLQFLVDEGLGKGEQQLLDRAFLIMSGVVLLLAATTFFRFMLITWLGEKVVADIRRDVFSHMIHLDVGFYETTRTGEILSRMTTDTSLLQSVVGSSISVALRNCLLLLGASVMLIITSPKLALYVAIIVPVVIFPIVTLGRKVRALSRAQQDRMADVSARIEECVSGIRAVQALSLEQEQQRHFNNDINALLTTAKSRIQNRSWLTAIVITLVFGAITTVLWIGGRDVLSGDLSPGALSAFIFYSVVAAGAVGAISEVIGDLQRAAGATERLHELLLTPSALPLPETPLSLPAHSRGEIAFRNVTFCYPSRPDKATLKQVNLTIAAGETVASVGPSGAGKTTLLQLLMRFYDPQEGGIFIDDMPINQLMPQDIRRIIGLVPQDPVIFSGNAWENIRAGFLDASDEDVTEAAAKARAKDFLDLLPQGFASHLGEKGIRLSGGQRQRLAIARALVRNPRILLLDEATNALDAENEHLVQQAIEASIHGRTTLVIAHRLSTILNADKIIVMENGEVQAIGRHAELLETSPLYKRLAELQFHTQA